MSMEFPSNPPEGSGAHSDSNPERRNISTEAIQAIKKKLEDFDDEDNYSDYDEDGYGYRSNESYGTLEEARLLIENGEIDFVSEHLSAFQGGSLDTSIAQLLIEKGRAEKVFDSLYVFSSLNEVVKQLVPVGLGSQVLYALARDHTSSIDANIVFEEMISCGQIAAVAESVGYFYKGVSVSVAAYLINAGRSNEVLLNLSAFSDVEKVYEELLKFNGVSFFSTLLEEGLIDIILENLGKYTDIDASIAYALVDKGKGGLVIQEINNFKNIDISELALKLILKGNLDDVGYHSEIFHDLEASIADKVMEKGGVLDVIQLLGVFKDIDDRKVADRVLDQYGASTLEEHIYDFQNLEPDFIEYIKKISKSQDSKLVHKEYGGVLPYSEIIANYDDLRFQAWKKDQAIGYLDQDALKELQTILDDKTIAALWRNAHSEELHLISPNILKMYNLSGLDAAAFRGQYIEKIIRDGSNYHFTSEEIEEFETENEPIEMDALHYFQSVVENINENSEAVLQEAGSYEITQELAEFFRDQGPFKNWENLKKYYELSETLKRRDVLEKLSRMKKEGKEKQAAFFSKLAFHPGSKISMQAVFQFMEDPERFLDVGDTHSGEAHERKKPSNYTQFSYLDLTAEDLRDGLIEGSLDKLQYFQPFEAGYTLPSQDLSNGEVINLLQKALGSFKEKIKGDAQSPGKLFKEIETVLKRGGITYQELVSNPAVLQDSLRTEIEAVLFNKTIGIKDARSFEQFLIKVHPKSSPEGHLAGNDTACCMPFGSGKNNIYMYNLGCATLTIQRKVGTGYRTIAQSVLTPDVDIEHSIADLVQSVESEKVLSDVIEADLSKKRPIIITADNIEVAPNAEKYKEKIAKLYEGFLAKYISQMENKGNIDTTRAMIGKGYNDLPLRNTTSVLNTYLPVTPVAYSDNYGDDVFELKLRAEESPSNKNSNEAAPISQAENEGLPKGISRLTAFETLRVSYMEGKVYADNESLIQYIHRIGNELTAKDINNEMKNRPNLSLKIEDEDGTMLGYLIAYEGVRKGYEDENGESVIYISDLAADTQKSKLAGGRLIKAFEELVGREYLSKGQAIPIIAEARETTSYPILQNYANGSREQYGYTYELEEGETEERGEDVMHHITLRPVKV